MKQAISVWLPTWSVDRITRRRRAGSGIARDRVAILLSRQDHQREVVARCCGIASAAGVRAGMTVAHARALLPGSGVHVEAFDPEADERALRSLAEWAIRFSPTVAVDPPDALFIDATGCDRLYRGEERLVNAVANSIRRLGFACRVCMAPTFGAAWAAARFGERERCRLDEAGLGSALGPMPVAALRIDEDIVRGLLEIGIERIGELVSLPRQMLPARFGEALLLQLDRAFGDALELIEPIRPTPPPVAVRTFDGPVSRLDAIELATRELLEALCARLARLESGARCLRFRFDRSDLDPTGFEIVVGRACRDVRHLWTLASPRLESVHLGFGVDRITVVAAHVTRLRHDQREWSEGRSSNDADSTRLFAEMVDTLSARLGPACVTRIRAVESHVPERAFVHVPTADGPGGGDGAAGIFDAARPSLLFERPERAEVISITPDGPPFRVRWRDRVHTIAMAVGPERIAGEWWADPLRTIGSAAYDYFQIQTDEGRWLWVKREVGTSRWWVHGEWV